MAGGTLSLQPHAVLRLLWDGVPTQEQVDAARAIPGARAVTGGYEWGWWSETAKRLSDTFAGGRQRWFGHDHGPEFGFEGWTWVDQDRVRAVQWRSPTPPRPHQLAFKAWRRGGGRDGLYHPGALLEAGLGLGKTLSAIEEILELLQHRPRARVLVLCRRSLIEATWAAQLAEHAPGLVAVLLLGPRKERLELVERVWKDERPYVFLHSYEDLPGKVEVRSHMWAMGKVLAELEWDMIVVDETAEFRTASAQRTGRLTGYQARPLTAPYRLGLSGLPIVKKATDAYPVLRWLGAPTGNKQQFTERFMVQRPYTQELVLGDPAGLASLLDAWRFQVPKSAVLNIPRTWHYEAVELRPWQREAYRKVRRELQRLRDEELASTQLLELLRLAQVTAGFQSETYLPNNAKLEHLLEHVLPLWGDDQAIIWTRFRHEALGVWNALRLAGRRAVAYTGALEDRENDASFRAFTSGEVQFFVPTLAKGALGLNLPGAAHMAYLSRDFGTNGWVQSLERNARLTTRHQHLTVTVLEATLDSARTIDHKVSEVLGDDLHLAQQLTALDVAQVLGR